MPITPETLMRESSATAAWRTDYWSVPSVELQSAGSDGEIVVAKARMGLAFAVMLIPVVALMQATRSENWLSFAVAMFAFAVAVGVYSLAKRHVWVRWLGLATSLGDITMVSIAHALWIIQGTPTLAANSRTSFTVYAVAIAATTLRFDVRICLVAGAVAVIQYAGISWTAYHVWSADPGPDTVIYGIIEPAQQVGRIIVLMCATWLAVAVVRQSARMRFASTHDRLTSMLNRGYFDERFAEEVARSKRTGAPLAVALMDVDHFKQINDRHGHPVGDAALKAVSQAIRSAIRRTDIVARYGGEEFVMMFDETEPTAALERLEKVCLRVAAQEVAVPGGPPILVTLSAGLAIYPGDGIEAADLIRAADDRLLQAKRTGRNRSVSPLGG